MQMIRPGAVPAALAACGILVTVAACRGGGGPPGPAIDVTLSVSPTPATVGVARVLVVVHGSTGAPVNDAEVLVEGDMTHSGMPPSSERAEPAGQGRYVVAAFPLVMAGEWVLTARATVPNGEVGVGRLLLTVVGPPTRRDGGGLIS